jgi:hypothetical protein
MMFAFPHSTFGAPGRGVIVLDLGVDIFGYMGREHGGGLRS